MYVHFIIELLQTEDEALARALAESERLTNGNTNNPQQRCSVSWNYEMLLDNPYLVVK